MREDINGDVVMLDGEIFNIGERKLHACLVCKVVSTKAIPWEVFCAQIPKLLHFVGSMNIETIGSNLFIMEFSSLIDWQRVLSNDPWNLFKNLLVFC